jgi:AraC-like DNA-binding protein
LKVFFSKAESLARNFESATKVPVRLVAADEEFELPPALHEACLHSRELSDTAVECLRFHERFYLDGGGLKNLNRAVCRNGLINGVVAIGIPGRALAYVEVGPISVSGDSDCEPALSLVELLVSQLRNEAVFVEKSAESGSPPFLRKAIEHIEANLDQQLTLVTVAKVASLSPAHFGRVFHRHTGKTLSEYVTALRIESACRMLTTSPHARISEIAMDCGFESIPYFNRVFVKNTGLSPSRYRLQQAAMSGIA